MLVKYQISPEIIETFCSGQTHPKNTSTKMQPQKHTNTLQHTHAPKNTSIKIHPKKHNNNTLQHTHKRTQKTQNTTQKHINKNTPIRTH